MNKLSTALFVSSVVSVVACSTSVSPEIVRAKAASDLSCAKADMKVEQINDNNWKVTGCNQAVTYVCSGSNFMSNGMCMREGAVPTSATMPK